MKSSSSDFHVSSDFGIGINGNSICIFNAVDLAALSDYNVFPVDAFCDGVFDGNIICFDGIACKRAGTRMGKQPGKEIRRIFWCAYANGTSADFADFAIAAQGDFKGYGY